MAGSPFILIPAAPVHAPHPTPASPAVKRVSFKPPAHLHAQQLHSIPPSSTSTRSLILDRTLEHLTDVRLAAAKAQLGAGGVTSQLGPDSVRHRHEFYTGYAHSEEDTPRDERLAARLESKAKGISNILCAMLAQEPLHRVSSSAHTRLPNDVRFRLTMAVLLEHYFAPSSPEPVNGKEKMPEIPLELAPFVSLSSYRQSSPGMISRPSHPTLPSLKSLNLACHPPSPQSPFAAFSAAGASPRPVKPLFFAAGPSAVSSSPLSAKSVVAPPATTAKESQNPVPVFRWPSQGPSSEAGPSSPGISGTPAAYPKTMVKSMNWIMPGPISNDKEKASAALWEQGLSAPSELSKTPCTRHLHQGCKVHTCITPSLPRSERSSIGAGLDSRRSRLDIFSDSTEAEEGRARMLNVLSEFVRLSTLLSSEITSGPSSSSSSPPRKEWYDLLALILTRAVLEGYILHGWRGTRAAQVLFGFGGSSARAPIPRKTHQNEDEHSESSEDEDEEAEFSPDGYPTLGDAYRKLFPSSPSMSTSSTEYLEELKAFREEMGRRRSEFLTPTGIPSGGLEAHINALNEKYSAESLDKKVIAFMEHISSWKGGTALERAKAVETKRLHVYFRAPASAKPVTPNNSMDVDDGESSSDESDSQSEDGDSDGDRTPPARTQPSLSAASKRPRASSLSDNVQTVPADNQTSPPPLKKERLGVPA